MAAEAGKPLDNSGCSDTRHGRHIRYSRLWQPTLEKSIGFPGRLSHAHVPSYHAASMATPEMSDTLTNGVRVGATAYFLPEESDPDDRKYLFGYTIAIKNEGTETVQ